LFAHGQAAPVPSPKQNGVLIPPSNASKSWPATSKSLSFSRMSYTAK
jgi:hypothetical protein